MEKVGETDTEQQKKRKHKEQHRAEKAAEDVHGKDPSKEELLVKEINLPLSSAPAVQKPHSPSVKSEAPSVEKKEPLSVPLTPQKEPSQVSSQPHEKKPSVSFEETLSSASPILSPEVPKKQAVPVPTQKHVEETSFTPGQKPQAPPKEKQVVSQPMGQAPYTPQPTPPGPLLPLPQAPVPGVLQMPPAIMDMFERMVGVMTVMQTSNVKETVIHLTHDKLKGSVFYGAQIVIQEHKSAPREFNIQLVGNNQAVEAFQAKVPMIYHGFQTGNYDFKVHRLEVSLHRDDKHKKVRDVTDDRREKGSS